MSAGIKLIVGLGNPGAEYVSTRHNAGFWWVDCVAHDEALRTACRQAIFTTWPARVGNGGDELWLLQPQTYMNRSGISVVSLARFTRYCRSRFWWCTTSWILPQAAKLKQGGGHGGHNGLKDIIAHLGTPNFWRCVSASAIPVIATKGQFCAEAAATGRAAGDRRRHRCVAENPALVAQGDFQSHASIAYAAQKAARIHGSQIMSLKWVSSVCPMSVNPPCLMP